LRLERATVEAHPVAGGGNGGGASDGYRVIGLLRQDAGPRRKVEITIETAKGERTHLLDLESTNSFAFDSADRPVRLIVDKYNRSAKANGSPFGIASFEDERDRTLIVYGTRDEEAANRETALALQERIRTHWSNQTIPIKADRDASDDDLRDRHLLLIGRPDTNRVVERIRDALPITFGWRSFMISGVTYAHAGSAVLAATANPLNPRYSAVVLAGLSSEATTRTPDAIYRKDAEGADVLTMPNGGKVKALAVPARDLVREFNGK
jgi:hypothetical protein